MIFYAREFYRNLAAHFSSDYDRTEMAVSLYETLLRFPVCVIYSATGKGRVLIHVS
jgi:hypothetical protein